MRRFAAVITAASAIAAGVAPAAGQQTAGECPPELGLPAPTMDVQDGDNYRPSVGIIATVDQPLWPPVEQIGSPDAAEAVTSALVIRRDDGRTWSSAGTVPSIIVARAGLGVFEATAWTVFVYPSGLECRVTRTAEFTIAPVLATPRAALRHVKRTIARVKTAARRERIDLLKTFITEDLEWSRDTWLDDVRQDRAKQAWERRLQQMGTAVALADRFPGNRFYLAKLEASAKRFGAQTLRYAAALTRRDGPDRPAR